MMDYRSLDNVPIIGGSWIVKQELVEKADWTGIAERTREASAALNG
jgi:2-keto-3-deoxy-6-phosphogluconate aldolase